MTHGFDDQGRQFDADGQSARTGGPRTTRGVQAPGRGRWSTQFDAYAVVDGVHVNGKLTLGENIADLGGLTIAYDAFRRGAARRGGRRSTA